MDLRGVATTYGRVRGKRNEPAPAEDCLFLNVWTPATDNRKRPVMFYSHGGGFVNGSGAASRQDGSNLARNFDVVVVETNHRLGLMGFLYLDELSGTDYFNKASIESGPGTDYHRGTPYAMDISFKFNNELPPRDSSAPKESFFGGNRPERFTASRHFAELWTTFARTGKPAAKDVPAWPAYNLQSRPTMRIDASCTIIDNRFSEELAMWRSLGKL